MQSTQDWPSHLDALIAAPRHHVLLFENDAVRVLETIIPAGDIVPLHTHRWPGAQYLLSFSNFIRRDAAGDILLDSRTIQPPAEGGSFWSAPLPPHTLENIGSSVLRLISVELKSPVTDQPQQGPLTPAHPYESGWTRTLPIRNPQK